MAGPPADLGAAMVREGFAWAFTRFSVDYVGQQEDARAPQPTSRCRRQPNRLMVAKARLTNVSIGPPLWFVRRSLVRDLR
jgi:hypothetical protein